MSHHIIALVFEGPCSTEQASHFGVVPIRLSRELVLCHIDHYFSMFWQRWLDVHDVIDMGDVPCIFPNDGVLSLIVSALVGREKPRYAVIMTDYFGGAGTQYAAVLEGTTRVSPDGASIDEALRMLGVQRSKDADEFDTVGLGRIRHQPDSLEIFGSLCRELDI